MYFVIKYFSILFGLVISAFNLHEDYFERHVPHGYNVSTACAYGARAYRVDISNSYTWCTRFVQHFSLTVNGQFEIAVVLIVYKSLK